MKHHVRRIVSELFTVAMLALATTPSFTGGIAGATQPAPAGAVAFGQQLAALAREGDVNGIAALAVTREYTCPVDPVFTGQVCEGLSAGTIVQGYPGGWRYSEGNAMTLDGYKDFLAEGLGDLASTDVRLCTVAAAGDVVVLTTPGDAVHIGSTAAGGSGNALAFLLTTTASGLRIEATIAGLAVPGLDADGAIVLGGNWYGTEMVLVHDPTPKAPSVGSGSAPGEGSGSIAALALGGLALAAIGAGAALATVRGRRGA